MKSLRWEGCTKHEGGGVESIEDTKKRVAECIHLFFGVYLVEVVPVCVHACLCVDACIWHVHVCIHMSGGQNSTSDAPQEPLILFLFSLFLFFLGGRF